jgi:hypothetical protein
MWLGVVGHDLAIAAQNKNAAACKHAAAFSLFLVQRDAVAGAVAAVA